MENSLGSHQKKGSTTDPKPAVHASGPREPDRVGGVGHTVGPDWSRPPRLPQAASRTDCDAAGAVKRPDPDPVQGSSQERP